MFSTSLPSFVTPPRKKTAKSNAATTSSSEKGTALNPSLRFYSATALTSRSSFDAQGPPPLWKPTRRRSHKCIRMTVRISHLRTCRGLLISLLCIVVCIALLLYKGRHKDLHRRVRESHLERIIPHVLLPVDQDDARPKRRNPTEWLREHVGRTNQPLTMGNRSPQRPRAAIISLVRNEELGGILQSMRQLEHHWNRRYHYPWIFFSESPFSEEFKMATSNATASQTSYELIPRAHWSTPEWIDTDRYMDSLDYLSTISVGKGHMLSYRNMCRWNSGFFYKHPALKDYDYYWRVEPDVHFFCDIPYDPFAFMAENDMVYGFNMNILDDARSFASLWEKTREFMTLYPNMVHQDADLNWLLDPDNGHVYNNCQFFSNFEIGSLNFFRDEPNEAYFNYLDRSGGFYYERFGDAPVHTLSVALFAPKSRVWFFRDIGYQHDIARHCPVDGVKSGLCQCEPTGLDENFYKLVPMESPQRKPADTCIRLWLGGEWLAKKNGWNQEFERAFGGDGFGGYVNVV